MDIQFRLGTVDDAGMIVGLINELAEYEKLPDKITTTEEDIRTATAAQCKMILLMRFAMTFIIIIGVR